MIVLGLGFLHPGLLALGGALVAVPILIHLFSRRRVRRQPWAAMQWLLTAVKRHQRRLRIENWLLLLLRALAVLLLGLALARPVMTAAGIGGLFANKRSIYLVLDNSYSMDASREGRSVLDLAKAEADAVLSDVDSEDTIAVLTTNDPRTERSDGRAPFVLTSRSVGTEGATRAKEAVAGLRVRHSAASWADTLKLLRRQTTKEDVNRLVVLVTDLQEADWDDETLGVLKEIVALPAAVRILEVGGRERPNLTVASVEVPMEQDAFAGRPLRLAATVENQGPKAVDGARVKVFLDGRLTPIRTVKVDRLPAFGDTPGKPGTAPVVVTLPGSELGEPGAHVLSVEISPPPEEPDADGLALDSRRNLAIKLRDRIHVATWTRASEGARLGPEAYLRSLYEQESPDATTGGTRDDNLYDLSHAVLTESRLLDALRDVRHPVDLVVLANVVPGREGAAALAGFVRSGGALLVFVGDHVRDPAALNDLFWSDAEQRLLPTPYLALDTRDRQGGDGTAKPFTLDFDTHDDTPIAEPFTGEDAKLWIGYKPPRIWGRLPFAVPGPDGGGTQPGSEGVQPVLHYAGDGSPFAVQGRFGEGKTLWVSTSIDDGWFEHALPFFLPVFLEEAAIVLTRPDSDRHNLAVGRSIVVTWIGRDAQGVRFIEPGGAKRAPTRLEAGGPMERPTWVLDRVGTVGVWKLTYDAEGPLGRVEHREEPFVVNPDPAEGRLHRAEDARILAPFAPEEDVRILSTWSEASHAPEEASQGELARLLLWIALAILVLEPVLAWAFGRQRAAVPEGTAS